MPAPGTEENWRHFLADEDPSLRTVRQFARLIPSDPRCQLCNLPFGGPGGFVLRLTGRGLWAKNPRYCTHARAAIEGARRIMAARGHLGKAEPWLPVGIGVHTGIAYVGTVGAKAGEERVELAALGDTANAAARLADVAGEGEIRVDEDGAARESRSSVRSAGCEARHGAARGGGGPRLL